MRNYGLGTISKHLEPKQCLKEVVNISSEFHGATRNINTANPECIYMPKEGRSIRDSTHSSKDKWRKVYLERGYSERGRYRGIERLV